MVAWRNDGGSRLDLDLDGKIDDPGAAVMDGSWDNIANAFMKPRSARSSTSSTRLFSRFDLPPAASTRAGTSTSTATSSALLGMKQPTPFENSYCGKGKLKACQTRDLERDRRLGHRDRCRAGHRGSGRLALGCDAEQIKFSPIR